MGPRGSMPRVCACEVSTAPFAATAFGVARRESSEKPPTEVSPAAPRAAKPLGTTEMSVASFGFPWGNAAANVRRRRWRRRSMAMV